MAGPAISMARPHPFLPAQGKWLECPSAALGAAYHLLDFALDHALNHWRKILIEPVPQQWTQQIFQDVFDRRSAAIGMHAPGKAVATHTAGKLRESGACSSRGRRRHQIVVVIPIDKLQ